MFISLSQLIYFLIIKYNVLIYTYCILLLIKISAEPFNENECFFPIRIFVNNRPISSDN